MEEGKGKREELMVRQWNNDWDVEEGNRLGLNGEESKGEQKRTEESKEWKGMYYDWGV